MEKKNLAITIVLSAVIIFALTCMHVSAANVSSEIVVDHVDVSYLRQNGTYGQITIPIGENPSLDASMFYTISDAKTSGTQRLNYGCYLAKAFTLGIDFSADFEFYVGDSNLLPFYLSSTQVYLADNTGGYNLNLGTDSYTITYTDEGAILSLYVDSSDQDVIDFISQHPLSNSFGIVVTFPAVSTGTFMVRVINVKAYKWDGSEIPSVDEIVKEQQKTNDLLEEQKIELKLIQSILIEESERELQNALDVGNPFIDEGLERFSVFDIFRYQPIVDSLYNTFLYDGLDATFNLPDLDVPVRLNGVYYNIPMWSNVSWDPHELLENDAMSVIYIITNVFFSFGCMMFFIGELHKLITDQDDLSARSPIYSAFKR